MRIERVIKPDLQILHYVEHKYRTLPTFEKFTLTPATIDRIMKHCDVHVAYDNQDTIKAMMVTFFGRNFLANDIKTLTLEAIVSDSPIATVILFELFVDMGKKYADHLIMSKGVSTNLKDSTLIKLGFKPLETIYKLEV